MKQTGRKPGPGSILTVVMDDHNVHCLTETHLDTWWASLPPAEKAEIYDASLECPSQQMRADYPWSLLNEAERVSSSFAALSKVKLDRTAKPTTEDGHAIR